MNDLACTRHIDTIEQGEAEERCAAEERFALFVDLAKLIHLPVEVEKHTVGIVEGHGDEVGVEHLLVLVGNGSDTTFLVDLLGDVLSGIENILWLAILLFYDGIAIENLPDGLFGGALIEIESHVEVTGNTRYQLCVERVQLFCLFRRQALEEVFRLHLVLWQQVAALVAKHVGLEVPFHHEVVAHTEHLIHHLSQVGAFPCGHYHTSTYEPNKQEHDDGSHKQSCQNDECHRRSIVVLTLRTEPVVIDILQFAGLLQTCVLVVDEVNQLFVVAYDSQFACRDVYLVEDNAVEPEFLNLMDERLFSPHVILVLALTDA